MTEKCCGKSKQRRTSVGTGGQSYRPRYGRLEPGDRIVLVATASAHRQEAFDACAFCRLTQNKGPVLETRIGRMGAQWVKAKETDDRAAERWGDHRDAAEVGDVVNLGPIANSENARKKPQGGSEPPETRSH